MNTDQLAAEAAKEIRNFFDDLTDMRGSDTTLEAIIKVAIEKALSSGNRNAVTARQELSHTNITAAPAQSRAAHASEPWTPKFAGGDAWRIDGSPCSYGYSKQQAEEICNAHNVAVAHASEPWTTLQTIYDQVPHFQNALTGKDGRQIWLHDLIRNTLSQRPTPATDDTKRLDWLLNTFRVPTSFIRTAGGKVTRQHIDAAMSQTKEGK